VISICVNPDKLMSPSNFRTESLSTEIMRGGGRTPFLFGYFLVLFGPSSG
jgi:hypothetical protein